MNSGWAPQKAARLAREPHGVSHAGQAPDDGAAPGQAC